MLCRTDSQKATDVWSLKKNKLKIPAAFVYIQEFGLYWMWFRCSLALQPSANSSAPISAHPASILLSL